MTKHEFIEKALFDYALIDVNKEENERVRGALLDATQFREDYNGWTNYETWRINLEFFDGMDFQDEKDLYKTIYELSESLKSRVEEYMDESTDDTLVLGWARAFVSDVNFMEIAKSINESYELVPKEV